MPHLCSPDHGMAIMLICIGLGVGMLVGKVLSDIEHRGPPG